MWRLFHNGQSLSHHVIAGLSVHLSFRLAWKLSRSGWQPLSSINLSQNTSPTISFLNGLVQPMHHQLVLLKLLTLFKHSHSKAHYLSTSCLVHIASLFEISFSSKYGTHFFLERCTPEELDASKNSHYSQQNGSVAAGYDGIQDLYRRRPGGSRTYISSLTSNGS